MAPTYLRGVVSRSDAKKTHFYFRMGCTPDRPEFQIENTMCLLLMSLDERPKAGRYAVIIANNRDEYWDRPSKAAKFWKDNPDCISGLHQKPGKRGGTWMGLSKTGHFASIFNILCEKDVPQKNGRGRVVINYLISDDRKSYLDNLFSDRDSYNGFNLVTLGIRSGWQYTLTFLSSWKQFYDQPIEIPSQGFHGFGNCRHKPTWRKVEAGKSAFQKIVENNGTIEQKETFLTDLFDLLSDKTRHLPDQTLTYQSKALPVGLRQHTSAINFWSPVHRCGTRTMTVILIDSDGNADYVEKTLKSPVDEEAPEWITSRYRFKMRLDD